MDRFVLLLLDDVESDVRELMHLAVKKHAVDWWHALPDVWIVKSSKSPNWWQERLEILFGLSGSLLVLALPVRAHEREVGYYLRTQTKSSDWFKTVYQDPANDDPWSNLPPALEPPPEDDDEPPF